MTVYKGKISNKGTQEVKAPYANTSSKKPTVKQGEDLRSGSSKKA